MAKKTDKSAYNTTLLYLIVLISLISLVISSISLSKITSMSNPSPSIQLSDIIEKLTAHEELAEYKDVTPLNIIVISNNNLGNLQGLIQGLDVSYIGDYLLQYADRLIIYDYNNDNIKANMILQAQQQQQTGLPPDFQEKLLAHPELNGADQTTVQGGAIDQASLQQLQQNFPDIYANAKVGDFLLRYSDRLIVYDYNQDRIVVAVPLEQP